MENKDTTLTLRLPEKLKKQIKGLPKEVNLSEEVRKVLELKVKSHNNEGIMCFLCWNENLAPNELSLLKSPLDDEEGHKQFFFLCDECILKIVKQKPEYFEEVLEESKQLKRDVEKMIRFSLCEYDEERPFEKVESEKLATLFQSRDIEMVELFCNLAKYYPLFYEVRNGLVEELRESTEEEAKNQYKFATNKKNKGK